VKKYPDKRGEGKKLKFNYDTVSKAGIQNLLKKTGFRIALRWNIIRRMPDGMTKMVIATRSLRGNDERGHELSPE